MISITITDADALQYLKGKAVSTELTAMAKRVEALQERLYARDELIIAQKELIADLKKRLEASKTGESLGAKPVDSSSDLFTHQRAKQDEIEGKPQIPTAKPAVSIPTAAPVTREKTRKPVEKVNGRSKTYKFTAKDFELFEAHLGKYYPSSSRSFGQLFGKLAPGLISRTNLKARMSSIGLSLHDHENHKEQVILTDKSVFYKKFKEAKAKEGK